MPFILNQEEEKAASQAAPKISGVSTQGINVPQGTAKAAGPQATGPKASGQYNNIQSYLRANESQAGEMAGKIASDVQAKAQAVDEAGKSLVAEAPKVAEYKPQETLARVAAGETADQQAYRTMRDTGGYQGPQDLTGLSGYQTVNQRGEEAINAVKAAQTEGGQRELLRSAYGRAGYGGTSGANVLDQALLAQSASGRQAIADIGTRYAGLTEALKGYQDQAQNQIAASQAQAQANRAAFAPAEAKARADFLAPLAARAEQANRNEPYNALTADIQDLALDDSTLAAFGLTPGQRVYGANLSNFVTGPQAAATAATIANQDERKKYNQLMDFIGANPQDIGVDGPNFSPYQVDRNALAAELGSRQATYDTSAADGAKAIAARLDALPNGPDAYNGLTPAVTQQIPDWREKLGSYEGLKEVYSAVQANQTRDPIATQMWNVLHGAPPPGNWNWDQGTVDRYRQSYGWILDMENQIKTLENLGAQNLITKNQGAV